MNFLEKIEMLMSYKKINKRQLSIGSDIPYSTIDNFWKNGYDNIKLSTLKKLSSYFNVSLDFLVRDDLNEDVIKKTAPVEQVSESDFQKRRLLHNYDNLNQTGKDKLVDYSDDLSGNSKYTEKYVYIKSIARDGRTSETRLTKAEADEIEEMIKIPHSDFDG